MSNVNVGILYVLAISSLGVYGIIIGGMGFELEISLYGSAKIDSADDFLRSFNRVYHFDSHFPNGIHELK